MAAGLVTWSCLGGSIVGCHSAWPAREEAPVAVPEVRYVRVDVRRKAAFEDALESNVKGEALAALPSGARVALHVAEGCALLSDADGACNRASLAVADALERAGFTVISYQAYLESKRAKEAPKAEAPEPDTATKTGPSKPAGAEPSWLHPGKKKSAEKGPEAAAPQAEVPLPKVELIVSIDGFQTSGAEVKLAEEDDIHWADAMGVAAAAEAVPAEVRARVEPFATAHVSLPTCARVVVRKFVASAQSPDDGRLLGLYVGTAHAVAGKVEESVLFATRAAEFAPVSPSGTPQSSTPPPRPASSSGLPCLEASRGGRDEAVTALATNLVSHWRKGGTP